MQENRERGDVRPRILRNKVAIVTGGASGIGKAAVKLFAAEGAAVVVLDLDQASGETLAREFASADKRVLYERGDAACPDDCERVIGRTLGEFGALHILFNNAGIIRRSNVVELSEQDWTRVMDVNVKSMFLMSKFAVPAIAKSGGGSIINMGSGWGLAGGARAAAYCASKGAVVQLTRAMAIDHGPQKIRVNCLCPGDTDTAMLDREAKQLGEESGVFRMEAANRPLGRIGRPEELAQAALYLASDESAFVTGAMLIVDGGGLA
jgi:NAD(P)-dependent dehydrogenase (short-subunit alcohol dehydrogenase family)